MIIHGSFFPLFRFEANIQHEQLNVYMCMCMISKPQSTNVLVIVELH